MTYLTRLSALAFASIALLFIGCTTANEADEPAQAHEPMMEDDDEHTEQMRQQMHQRFHAMLGVYTELDEAYAELEEDDELEPELAERVDEMRRHYDEMLDRHERMHRGMHGEEDEQDEDDHHRMRREQMRRMMDDHGELVDLHEEMAEMNRDAERDDLAELHEELTDHHAEMERMCEQMMDRMMH